MSEITPPGLGRRIAKGALWMVGSRFAIRGIGLVSTVVLARLLRPEDFGLVALAAALVGAVEVFSNFSFDLALIFEGQARRDHYDTVWTLTIIRGMAVALILAALAGPAVKFFNDRRIEWVVYAFAAGTLIEGLQNVGIVDFRKELNFHQEFAFVVYGKLAAFAITVPLAFLWREYSALVVGVVVGRVASLILSYVMHPYRPRISLKEWRRLMGYSKWLLAANVSGFLGSRLDTFVIGRVVGAHALGLYEISNEISSLPTGELVWPIQRALYPGYAKLSQDRQGLARYYVVGFSIIMMIALPPALGIAAVAEPIIRVFLGERWLEALPVLQVLAIAGIFKVGNANSNSVLMALGKTRLISHLAALNFAMLAILVIAGTTVGGVMGTAYAVVAASAIILVTSIGMTLRMLSLSVRALIAAVWRSLIAGSIMALSVHFLIATWPQTDTLWSAVAELLAAIAMGGVAYIGVHLTLWRLAGSPEGAEKNVLTAAAPLARNWRSAVGFGS